MSTRPAGPYRDTPGRWRRALVACAAAIFAAAALGAAASPAAAGKPVRIVSINLCGDELALRLAGRERVRSVTFLAHDPAASNVADLAAGIPANAGAAEEVVAHRPDIVLAGRYTTRLTVSLLRDLGVPVLELDVAASIDDARRQIATVAEALGEAARGAAMIAAIDARIAAARIAGAARAAAGRPRAGALVLEPAGFTIGAGSLADAILRAAGLVNLGARLDRGGDGRMPLEAILAVRPDWLVVDGAQRPGPALAYETLDHRAFAALPDPPRTLRLPTRLWTCPGPGIADAVALLAEATSPPSVPPPAPVAARAPAAPAETGGAR